MSDSSPKPWTASWPSALILTTKSSSERTAPPTLPATSSWISIAVIPGALSRFSQQNLGAMRNFEAAVAACRGQYLAFLEGDDYWACEDKLQRQVDFLDPHPDFAICCHPVRFLDDDASAKADEFRFLPAGPYTIEDLLKGNFVMTCSTVLRRDLIPPLPRWFSKMKLRDWPLFPLLAQHGKI